MLKLLVAIRIYATFLIWDAIGTIWNYAEIGEYRIELKHKKFWAYRITGIYAARFTQRPSIGDILGVL